MDAHTEEILKEIKLFIGLNPEDREKQRKALAKRAAVLENKITENAKALDQLRKRLSESKARLEAIKTEYAEAREKRQKAILLDQDSKDVVPLLRKLSEEEELLTDTCIGLGKGIEDLIREGDSLPLEKTKCEQSLLRLELVPLVFNFNEAAEVLKGSLIRIQEVMLELGEVFSSFTTTCRTVFSSNFEGLERIPKLYFACETGPENKTIHGYLKDTFNFRHHLEQLRKEKEAKKIIEQ